MTLEPREFSIVGESVGDRQDIIAKQVRSQMVVILRREPQNPHDSNAVAIDVQTTSGVHTIGYLGRKVAAEIAPLMDKGIQIPARIARKYGGTNSHPYYGVRVELDIDDGSIEYFDDDEPEEIPAKKTSAPVPAAPAKSSTFIDRLKYLFK